MNKKSNGNRHEEIQKETKEEKINVQIKNCQ